MATSFFWSGDALGTHSHSALYGTTSLKEIVSGTAASARSAAAAGGNRSALASALSPGTTSTAGPAPGCPPRPADADRRSASRSPYWCRSRDRRHRAMGFQRGARLRLWATTAPQLESPGPTSHAPTAVPSHPWSRNRSLSCRGC
jgi:hypothetical protein